MPRPSNGFRLYERAGSRFWWVRFTVAGRTIRRSTEIPLEDRSAAQKEAAALVFREHAGAGRNSGAAAPVHAAAVGSNLDLTSLYAMWIEHLDVDAKNHGRAERYTARIETDLQYIAVRWNHPSEIDAESWERHKAQLHSGPICADPACRALNDGNCADPEKHETVGPLKWRSVAHLANTLRHFLRYCAKLGVIHSAPELLSPPTKLQKREQAPREAFDEEEREAFLWALAVMGEWRALRIYTALFETWVRKSTLEAMTPRWVNFRAETITLPAEFNKSRREKVIDLTPRAAEAIRSELDARGTVGLDEPIFGRFDFHQSWAAKGGIFGRALALAGIDRHGLTPHHSTRHTAVTLAGAKPGASVSALMAQAGWDTAQMAERYLHPDLAAARRLTRTGR